MNLIFLFLCLLLSQISWADSCHVRLIGAVERVMLLKPNLIFDAKVDTGAALSSLSAIEIKTFRSNNRLWVRFAIPSNKQKIILVKPVLRYSAILKRHEERSLSSEKFSLRPVIELPICLGKEVKIVAFNLTDRSDFRYPVLLGRETLKQFHLVVDVEKSHLMPPGCGTNF